MSACNLVGMKYWLSRLSEGTPLTQEEAEQAFSLLIEGSATPAQIGAFLMALRMRGETVEELTGAFKALQAKMVTIQAPPNAIDVCGTGGDGLGSLNVSTAVSMVVAGCGIPVAKHGNRAMSSQSGAADILGALGVNLDAEFPLLEKSLKNANIAFLLAPRHHPAMRHVGPIRAELGLRTIFNLIGPVCNPAAVKRQLLGIFARHWLTPLGEMLQGLGCERAWLVHGADGLDELSISGPSYVIELNNGRLRKFEVRPEDAGLRPVKLTAIKGGDASANAERLKALLAGADDEYRQIVLLNAAAALIVAGVANDLREGVVIAKEAIDQGRARQALDQMIAYSHNKGV